METDTDHAWDGLLDVERLNDWIETTDAPGQGPVAVIRKLEGGSQNNIFLLRRGEVDMVLRRPPAHLRANSNETMVREARVLAALAGSSVPHPELYSACPDTDVIGASFYLMAPIDGFTPRGTLPGSYSTEPSWRRDLAFEMARAAAALGSVDYVGAGLSDYGRPERWLERQVARWRSQLEGYGKLPGYTGPELPHVEKVGVWLEDNRPSEARIGIVHGDYQFANVMFSLRAPHLAAIVDWELCSLGDPLLDLAWMLTAWHEEGDPPGHEAQFQPWSEIPSRQEVALRYSELSGRPIDALPWFFTLACYKLGIILEGTFARAKAGQAAQDTGDRLHAYAGWLFQKAAQAIAYA